MILQALTAYYQALEQKGKVSAPGWAPVKVSYALYLSPEGEPEQIVSIKTEQKRGKKTVLAPQILSLPAPVKRSNSIVPNFLCDSASYLLGLPGEKKGASEEKLAKRALDSFAACKALHEELLSAADSPAAKAVLRFFETWDPEKAAAYLAEKADEEILNDLRKGANLLFRAESGFVHEDPAVRAAWNSHYNKESDGPRGICLVTGEEGPIEKIHPAIKNVAGAQPSGAALVSFNAPAFCSYGKEQNLNAPTGKYAAFAYTTALNYLLADRDHVYHIGDTSVVCWAKGGESAYNALFGAACFGADTSYTTADLRGMVESLCKGEPVEYDDAKLSPTMDFYVLGLSPNAARVSVRFFLHNTFRGFLENVQAHYDRLEIVRPKSVKFKVLFPTQLLKEINRNKSSKSSEVKKGSNEQNDSQSNDKGNTESKQDSHLLKVAGELLCSILTNTLYPSSLLIDTTLQIRAKRDVTHGRAAILKAYYLKLTESRGKENLDIPKEVLQVSLNPDATHVPYTLGRLFSVLEAVQEAANPGINTTIKDKYFNTAASTPAVVFPILINLAQKHLKKLRGSNRGLAILYDKQLTELFSKLNCSSYPTRMNLPQQGSFQLGYYHQTQARYQKKEEVKNG